MDTEHAPEKAVVENIENKTSDELGQSEKGLNGSVKATPDVKSDSKGMPLAPQPSRFRDDPLNWPTWMKWAVLLQVSFAAFLGPFNCAVVNPSLVLLAKEYHVTPVKAAYNTTTAIILAGVMSFLWQPLSNVYGRRPIMLLCMVITVLGAVGSAVSKTFAALLGTRALNGIGLAAMMALGPPIINDMFFLHERGFKTGIYTVFIINGAHVAVLFGGYLGQIYGVAWDFWVPAIATGASFLVALFLLPETMFSRHPDFLANRTRERTYFQMLFDFKGNLIPARRLQLASFGHSFVMLKYPSIAFPALYYFIGWTFINTLPAVTIATTYTQAFHWQSGKIGLCLGISLMIGSLLAELVTGRVTDLILYLDAKRNNGIRRPEARLYQTLIAAVFQPVGLIIYGFCIQEHKSWVAASTGLAVGAFGLQMGTTCLYAYVSDCYKPQTSESSSLFNLGRGLAFVVGYFGIPFAVNVGYGWAWFTFAIITVACYIPIGALIIWGAKWRANLGEPKFDRYI